MQQLINTNARRIRSEVSNHPIKCFFFLFFFFGNLNVRRTSAVRAACHIVEPGWNPGTYVPASHYHTCHQLVALYSADAPSFPYLATSGVADDQLPTVPSLTGLSVVLWKFNSCRSWPPIMSFHLGNDSRFVHRLCIHWADWFRDHEKTFSSISRWCVPRMPRRQNYLDDSAPGFMGLHGCFEERGCSA